MVWGGPRLASSGDRKPSIPAEKVEEIVLIDAIQAHLAAHNENPKPLQWTATAEQILEQVRRGRVALDAIPS